MGLLDGLDSPEMGFAFGLLDAAGPSRMPVSFGQGLSHGMQQYRAAKEAQQAQAFKQMQMDAYKAQQEEAERKRQALMQFREKIPEQLKPMFDADPNGVMALLMKEPEKPQLVTVQTPNGPMQKWVVPGQPSGVDVGAPVDKEAAPPWYVHKGKDGSLSIDPAFSALEREKAAYGRQPAAPMQPVAYVDDAGRTVWGTIAEAKGKPAANYNPTIQGAIAGAKKEAETGVTTRADAQKAITKSEQLLSITKQAESLLDANPTGSGVGAAVDAAGRLIGQTSDSAKAASELETLSGWMVSNVPRMEGPQSNFDVKNYETMAAKVGDRTVPVAERKAALKVLVKLQEKYKHLNEGIIGEQGTNRFDSMPKASLYKGRKIKADDGTVYVSNGLTWVKE